MADTCKTGHFTFHNQGHFFWPPFQFDQSYTKPYVSHFADPPPKAAGDVFAKLPRPRKWAFQPLKGITRESGFAVEEGRVHGPFCTVGGFFDFEVGPHGGAHMQTTQLPRKIMEGMRSRFVHCVVGSTPPHFVVDAISAIVQSVLTHTLVGTVLFIRHNTCGVPTKWNSELWS